MLATIRKKKKITYVSSGGGGGKSIYIKKFTYEQRVEKHYKLSTSGRAIYCINFTVAEYQISYLVKSVEFKGVLCIFIVILCTYIVELKMPTSNCRTIFFQVRFQKKIHSYASILYKEYSLIFFQKHQIWRIINTVQVV